MKPTLSKTLFILKKWGISLVLAVFIGYQLIFTWIPLWIKASDMKGVDVSHYSLTDETGQQVELSRYRGAPLIINFWATWCLPCRVEIPLLASAYPDLKAQGKELLGVNLKESWPTIKEYLKDVDMPYPVFLDKGELSGFLGIGVIPALVIIDSEGKVEAIVYGFRPWVQWYLKYWI